MCDWMGRFSGGTPARWESRSEINVRAPAAATAPIIKTPCHQDRDSFGTISRIDIMGSETRGQTLLVWDLPDAHLCEMTLRNFRIQHGCAAHLTDNNKLLRS